MSNPNFDDHDLVRFLKQNRPIVPPPSPDLTARLMVKIAPSHPPKVGIALVAILVTLGIVSLKPTWQTASTDSENIEAQILSNWQMAEDDLKTSYSTLINF